MEDFTQGNVSVNVHGQNNVKSLETHIKVELILLGLMLFVIDSFCHVFIKLTIRFCVLLPVKIPLV